MPPAADSLLALADSGNVEALRHRVEALLSTEGTAALNASVASHRLRGFNAGLTPLMAAAKSGHSEAVQVLLDAGADPNAVDEEKWNALHYACFSGHASIAADLLHRGTDTALRTTFEKATPLDFASHRKFSDTVAVLGGEAPEPYTPSSREAVLRKGLTKLAGCRPAADGTYLLLHRYRVSPASHAMWLGYLQSGAQAAVRIPASDEELGTAVDILMYPSLPRPDVPGVLRHSSVSGLQHITVVRSGP